jgi:hypothetical protein
MTCCSLRRALRKSWDAVLAFLDNPHLFFLCSFVIVLITMSVNSLHSPSMSLYCVHDGSVPRRSSWIPRKFFAQEYLHVRAYSSLAQSHYGGYRLSPKLTHRSIDIGDLHRFPDSIMLSVAEIYVVTLFHKCCTS